MQVRTYNGCGMRLVSVIGTFLAAVAGFVTGGGLMFVAFSSFVWPLDPAVSKVAGAVVGVLFGRLVATPFV